MPQFALQVVGSPHKIETLPLTVRQQSSTVSALVRLAVLIPALLLVMVPAGSLLFSTPGLALLAEHPLEAAIGGTGIAVFLFLFGFPLARTIKALHSRRTVRIEAGFISVVDRSVWGTRTWTLPLSSYRGLAHLVRTNLSGARHELVLVHPERARQVLLCAADRLSEADLAQASAVLSLPLVPANDLYRWTRQPASRVEPRLPDLTPAAA